MPQRFLRPGLRSSVRFNSLDWFTQSFFVRLMTMVDDFGRYEAHPMLLKSEAFPLSENVTVKAIVCSCEQLFANDLAIFYEVEGKQYLQLLRWQEKPRAEESKYPEFLKNSSSCKQMFADVGNPPPPSSSSSSSPSSMALRARATIPPSDGDVVIYAQELGMPREEAMAFIDHHTARAWKLSRGISMKDWKAALRTWNKNWKSGAFAPKKNGCAKIGEIPLTMNSIGKTVYDIAGKPVKICRFWHDTGMVEIFLFERRIRKTVHCRDLFWDKGLGSSEETRKIAESLKGAKP